MMGYLVSFALGFMIGGFTIIGVSVAAMEKDKKEDSE